MKLESDGILIGMRAIGERDSVAVVFTREHGMMRGVMRAAQIAKKNKPLVGQIGVAAWNARLDSQLGTFHWEAEKNPAVALMLRPRALNCMNAAFDLLAALLPERVQFAHLYARTIDMLNEMAIASDIDDAYLRWEVELLRDAGYALDLTRCSGCGRTESLHYLSPRTGRAVCDACAAPYLTRVYKLPLTLNTTLRFIEGACAQQGTTVPPGRVFLCR